MTVTKKVENPSAERWIPDVQVRGLGIRARGSGAGTWQVRYSYGGKNCRLSFGSSDQISLQDARIWARRRFLDLAEGRDPAGARAEEEAKAKSSLGSYVAGYLRHMEIEGRAESYIAESRRSLTQYFKSLHHLAPDAIDRKMVAAELIRIRDVHGKIAATRARGHLSSMYSWLCLQGLADHVPTEKTITYSNPSRDRVLDDSEIQVIWRALDDDDFGDVMRLLFLTGCRKTEIADLQWSEADFIKRQINLPAARVKNRKAFTIPLSQPALEILKARQETMRRRAFVFGIGDGGFSGWGRAKRRLDKKTGIANPWVVHDIRRSVATLMGDGLKIPPHIIEAVLNHVSGHKAGVAGIYQRSEYKDERRQAIDALAGHITALVTP
jgi:integrase